MIVVDAVMWLFAGVLCTLAAAWVYAIAWIIWSLVREEEETE